MRLRSGRENATGTRVEPRKSLDTAAMSFLLAIINCTRNYLESCASSRLLQKSCASSRFLVHLCYVNFRWLTIYDRTFSHSDGMYDPVYRGIYQRQLEILSRTNAVAEKENSYRTFWWRIIFSFLFIIVVLFRFLGFF